MITNEQAEFLVFIYVVVLVLCRVLTIVLGSVAIFKKNGALKELGFYLLATGVLSLWSVVSMFLLRISEKLAVILNYISFGVAILSYAAFVLFFLYLKRSYKSRGLLYVCLFPTLWFIAMRFVYVFVMHKVKVDNTLTVVNIFNLVSVIAPVAIWIFFAAVCITSKDQEKIVPRLYVWCILFATVTIVNVLFNMFAGNLAGVINYIAAFIMSLLEPAFGIYLIVCLSRIGKKPKEV